MLALVPTTAVRPLELGIVTFLSAGVTAALAIAALPCPAPASAPSMPAPDPEPLIVPHTETSTIACDDPSVQTVVFKGRVNAIDKDLYATFHFRFADLPDRYTVMTGPHGEFEVRVSRAELGLLDLCTLPTSGLRNASFKDAQLSLEYVLSFER
jgi:hypothetical protein